MEIEKARVVRGDWCIGCGHCVSVCPVEAVSRVNMQPGDLPDVDSRRLVSSHELQHFLRARRSVRRYHRKGLPHRLVDQILEGGRFAPTGTNSQNVHYVIIDSETKIAALRQMVMEFYERVFRLVRNPFLAHLFRWFTGRRAVENLRSYLPVVEHAFALREQGEDPLLHNAPAVMIAHAESWDTCSAFNCAVALYSCALMAQTLNVGCCFNGFLEVAVNRDRKIKKWLELPRDHRCYGAMTLGYPDIQFQRLVEREEAKVRWR
jgi:nitroreductase